MPIKVKRIGKKYRLVEDDGAIAKNRRGTPIDGGGHSSSDKAIRQAQAIAISKAKIE